VANKITKTEKPSEVSGSKVSKKEPVSKIKQSSKSSKKLTKKQTKKSSRKTTKNIKTKVFKNIPLEQYFVLADGRKVEHYVTLANLLETMEKNIIHHHISEFHHDFANWIRDVFSEEELAEKIRAVHDPEKIRLIIYKHIIDKHLK